MSKSKPVIRWRHSDRDWGSEGWHVRAADESFGGKRNMLCCLSPEWMADIESFLLARLCNI